MENKGACVAFGSFEFVHRGHLAVAERVAELAREKNMQSVIISCPSGTEVYTTEKEKEYLLRECGIEQFVTYTQNVELETLLKYMLEELEAQTIVVGANDLRLAEIQNLASRYEIEMVAVPVEKYGDRVITYEWLVEAFSENDFELVTELCGHPYILIGDVVHGKKLGRTVGMPTTNLHIYKKKKRPNCGVYATKMILDDEICMAATNIGKRPTVDDFDYVTIESFILDFNRQVYGEICVLEVYRYLREVQKFECLEQVQKQVEADVEKIRMFFEQ